MKYKLIMIFLTLTLVFSSQLFGQGSTGKPVQAVGSVPFSKGVNITDWFTISDVHYNNAQNISFSRYSEKDFIDFKNLGIDVIRLGISFPVMTSGAPNYIIDPLLFRFLDIAADWAEKYQIYLILDNHHYDPDVYGGVAHTNDRNINIYKKIWKQIAEHFKNRSEYLLYEFINEPNNITAAKWGKVQGELIDIIRKVDKKHTIVVTGIDYSSIDSLQSLPKYSDKNLLYTFHSYYPHIFSHQGAHWNHPMEFVKDIPFPYEEARMPAMPKEIRGNSWIEPMFKNYSNEGTAAAISKQLDKAVAFSKTRNVPVYCGEWGAYGWGANPEDRIRYYQAVNNALNERNIPRTSWDYHNAFGIFNSQKDDYNFLGDINTDLNIELVRAMGFNPPPQRAKQIEQPRTNFIIYDDYFGRWITARHYSSESIFEQFNKNAIDGEHAILWGNMSRYDRFFINFNIIDINFLAQNGFRLEFKARTETPVHFDVWFEMPENDSSLPWRMRFTIDNKILPADGKWHAVSIPLANMREFGAPVKETGGYLQPQGKFSWRQVQQLVFSAEHADLRNSRIFIDSIRIVK